MPDLPVLLNLHGRRCVIVGGGPVAARRARALLDCGAQVTVIAPAICPAIAALSAVEHLDRPWTPGDLTGATLAIIATDNPTINAAAAAEAREAGALINRADDPAAGDLSFLAHARHGPVTLAVGTDGIAAGAAATICRQLSARLDPDWPRLLDLIAPYRHRIRQHIRHPATRQAALRQLADAEAMALLKSDGEAAVLARCRSLADNS